MGVGAGGGDGLRRPVLAPEPPEGEEERGEQDGNPPSNTADDGHQQVAVLDFTKWYGLPVGEGNGGFELIWGCACNGGDAVEEVFRWDGSRRVP